MLKDKNPTNASLCMKLTLLSVRPQIRKEYQTGNPSRMLI